MTTRELAREMRHAAGTLRAGNYRSELAPYGIRTAEIDAFQMVGIETVRRNKGGDLYEPDPDGRVALITPCLVHRPNSPESPAPDVFCRFGNLVDLVAWDPRVPNGWSLRVGAADWLGCVPPQHCDPDPVVVRRSPLSWFQAGCDGLVILTHDRAGAYRLLAGCAGGIIGEDWEHAGVLQQILDRPWPAPRVRAAS